MYPPFISSCPSKIFVLGVWPMAMKQPCTSIALRSPVVVPRTRIPVDPHVVAEDLVEHVVPTR